MWPLYPTKQRRSEAREHNYFEVYLYAAFKKFLNKKQFELRYIRLYDFKCQHPREQLQEMDDAIRERISYMAGWVLQDLSNAILLQFSSKSSPLQ